MDCNYIENTLIFSRNVTSFECCDFNLERNEDIDYRTRLILVVLDNKGTQNDKADFIIS